MKAAETLIAWTPATQTGRYAATAGQVCTGPLIEEGQEDWTGPFAMSGGAAYPALRSAVGAEAIALVFIEFQTMVVRDGIDPLTAHKAFLAIDEYRDACARDLPGVT